MALHQFCSFLVQRLLVCSFLAIQVLHSMKDLKYNNHSLYMDTSLSSLQYLTSFQHTCIQFDHIDSAINSTCFNSINRKLQLAPQWKQSILKTIPVFIQGRLVEEEEPTRLSRYLGFTETNWQSKISNTNGNVWNLHHQTNDLEKKTVVESPQILQVRLVRFRFISRHASCKPPSWILPLITLPPDQEVSASHDVMVRRKLGSVG